MESENMIPSSYAGYSLDSFQQEALKLIDKNHSFIVTAPTGAGKTLIAQYAVEKTFKTSTTMRIIYTSPIKALSNQKYLDFKNYFGEERVGLLTGDISINKDAQVVIMTTEILRNILLSDPSKIWSIAYVVFDEVHFMNDPLRGMVWEQTLILLPKHCKLLLLSATITNDSELATWLTTIRKEEIKIIKQTKRPIPLHKYVLTKGNLKEYSKKQKKEEKQEITLLVEQNDYNSIIAESNENISTNIVDFKKDNSDTAILSNDSIVSNDFLDKIEFEEYYDEFLLENEIDYDEDYEDDFNYLFKPYSRYNFYSTPAYVHILKFPIDMFPMLVFVFSRKLCADYAQQIYERGKSLVTTAEQKQINQYCELFITDLSPSSRTLRNVKLLLYLLPHGIAFHHAGLLPSLKTFIEKLFVKNLVKVVFATETFALGVNYPAKTVFFPEPKKWDGYSYRYLNTTEFIQMSGRAGRRGIDTEGNVILATDQLPYDFGKKLFSGSPSPIGSHFQLTYAIIASLRWKVAVDPKFFLNSSFLQYQMQKRYEIKQKQVTEEFTSVTGQLTQLELSCHINNSTIHSHVKKFLNYRANVAILQENLNLQFSSNETKKLKRKIREEYGIPGRIIYDNEYGWGVCLSVKPSSNWQLTCMTLTQPQKQFKISLFKTYLTEEIENTLLYSKDSKVCSEINKRYTTQPPKKMTYVNLIKQKKDTVLQTESQKQISQELQHATEMLAKHCCTNCKNLENHLKDFHTEQMLQEEKKQLEKGLNSPYPSLIGQFQAMEKFLKELGYFDLNDTLSEKGRVLAQLSTNNDVFICELLFSDVKLSMLSDEEWNAFFSIFVTNKEVKFYQNVSDNFHQLWGEINEVYEELLIRELIQGIKVQVAGRQKYSLAFYDAVTKWSKNYKLVEIVQQTKQTEGEILSTIRRMINLYRQFLYIPEFQKLLPEYYAKFRRAMELLRRGEAIATLPKEL